MPKAGTLDRREFTLRSVKAMLGGAAITLSGCADGPTQPTYNDTMGTVDANHGHTVVLTGAQLAAGGGVILEVQGSSTHPHQLELTAADVMAIREGQRISRGSTPSPSGSHIHVVTFN